MREPWSDDDEMHPDMQAVLNLTEATARFMEKQGCCDRCVEMVRSGRREAERVNDNWALGRPVSLADAGFSMAEVTDAGAAIARAGVSAADLVDKGDR